jgi:hypothetical protein
MRLAECDLCGSEDKSLNLLSPDYQTDRVKRICNSCLCDLHERVDRLVEIQNKAKKSFVKRIFSKMKSKIKGNQCD